KSLPLWRSSRAWVERFNQATCLRTSANRSEKPAETGTEPAFVATANNTPIYTHSWGKAIRHAANGDHIHRTMCGDWLARAEIAVHNHRMNSGDNKYLWQASDWSN